MASSNVLRPVCLRKMDESGAEGQVGRQVADLKSEPGRGCFLSEMESAGGFCATRSDPRVSRVTGQSKVGAGTPVRGSSALCLFPRAPWTLSISPTALPR